jgi:hypothetical protein
MGINHIARERRDKKRPPVAERLWVVLEMESELSLHLRKKSSHRDYEYPHET